MSAQGSDFRERGFLGDEAETYPTKLYPEYRNFFEYAFELNQTAHKLLNSIEKGVPNELRALVLITLYIRGLNAFAGVTRLLLFGMNQESGTLLRSLCEIAIFSAKAGIADEEWLKLYVELSKWYELKELRENYGDEEGRRGLSETGRNKTIERIAFLEKEAKILDLKRTESSHDFKVGGLAKSLNLDGLYDQAWRHFSTYAAHPSATSLDRFLRKDSQGAITGIVHGPIMDNVMLTVASACTCLIVCMETLEKCFGLGDVVSKKSSQEFQSFDWKMPSR
jgi:hypothetical protein